MNKKGVMFYDNLKSKNIEVDGKFDGSYLYVRQTGVGSNTLA